MKEMGNPIATHTAKDGRKNKERTKNTEGVLERHFLSSFASVLQVVELSCQMVMLTPSGNLGVVSLHRHLLSPKCPEGFGCPP